MDLLCGTVLNWRLLGPFVLRKRWSGWLERKRLVRDRWEILFIDYVYSRPSFVTNALEKKPNNKYYTYCWTGNEILEPGQSCGNGLTESAAREMGLVVGTPVATSLIDAHAGGLGMIGVGLKNATDFRNRLGKYYTYIEWCTWCDYTSVTFRTNLIKTSITNASL